MGDNKSVGEEAGTANIHAGPLTDQPTICKIQYNTAAQ